MKEVTATVTYAVHGVSVSVPDDAAIGQIREALFAAADYVMEGSAVEGSISYCTVAGANGDGE